MRRAIAGAFFLGSAVGAWAGKEVPAVSVHIGPAFNTMLDGAVGPRFGWPGERSVGGRVAVKPGSEVMQAPSGRPDEFSL